MNNLLVICGPTATGKTELAVKLAQKYNGELISADSRQIYKGMDIGTGKDIGKNSKFTCKFFRIYSANKILAGSCLRQQPMTGRQNSKLQIKNKKYSVGFRLKEKIPIWLVDIVEPPEIFTVADYYDLAWKVIENIWSRNKLPILVGGNGFYIKSIIDGINTIGIPQDWKLRKKLESLSLKELQNNLQKINFDKWNSMNDSDKNNPRRLIRAIEITEFNRKKITLNSNNLSDLAFLGKLNALQIGLTASNVVLYQKIDERVEKRLKEGIVNEIKSLIKKGYSWELPSMSGLGYRVWKDFFEKKKTLEETIQRWKFDEHNYCRRQLTWFKKDKRIDWFNIINNKYPQKISDRINKWLSTSCLNNSKTNKRCNKLICMK